MYRDLKDSLRRTATRSRTGFTLLEVVISVSIFAAMFVVILALLNATRNLTHTGETQVDLQEYSRRALEKVMDDLRQTGRTTVNGLQYPRWGNFSSTPSTTVVGVSGTIPSHILYTPYGISPTVGCGVPLLYCGNSGYFNHPAVPTHVSSTPEWQEASREIIYLLPNTLAGAPVDANGNIVWNPDEVALLVVQDPQTKINQLVRRIHSNSGGTDTTEVIANDVDRFVVEDIGSLPDWDGSSLTPTANLSLSQLRVTIYMAKVVTGTNTVLQSKFSTILVMRNNALTTSP